MDRGKATALVSLDLSAAFDMVNVSRLLNRLETSYNLNGPALAWLKSYLSDHKQFVQIG